MKRIAAHTLGCKLNFAETSHIVSSFVEQGWSHVDFDDIADLYVVNTCTVTSTAEKKCRNAIYQAVAKNPKAIVAVVGCFAQIDRDALAKINGVDIVLDNDNKHNLLQFVNAFLGGNKPLESVNSFHIAYSHSDRTRTFFKIQDGCDYFCSYCAIPFARGRSRSSSVEETMQTARKIAASGAKEVVLTGVNTGTFGQNYGENLLQLLLQLDSLPGIERFRISSIEPNLLTDDIINFVASSRLFLPHFHIPLQSGSNTVLKLMNRRYDTDFYASRIAKIKSLMPDACVAADIIVGFNGENETEFSKSLAFVDSIPISYLHVFTYSQRPRTKAANMDNVVDIHQRRLNSRRMQQLSDAKKRLFYSQQSGKTRPVLWESTPHLHQPLQNQSLDNLDHHNSTKLMYGFTDNYIRACRPYDQSLVNRVTDFELITLDVKEDLFYC